MIDISAFARTLNNRPVAVFGLGLSNRAVLRALTAAGVVSAAWDDNESVLAEAAGQGVVLYDLAREDMSQFACLVAAPGVMPDHPVVQSARTAGIEVICDLEILHRCGHGRWTVGITGTNGKSTTTALVGHILNHCGVPSVVGGNIGRAALDLDMPPESGAFVLEMSSYQLDLCPTFRPDIAVLLNITPDHIDHHGSMENYIAAKKRIFSDTSRAVIALDSKLTKSIYKELKILKTRRVCAVSTTGMLAEGVYADRNVLHDRVNEWWGHGGGETLHALKIFLNIGAKKKRFALDGIRTLRGQHNRQNIAAAWAVARLMNIPSSAIYEAAQTYPGLPHRQQLVCEMDGVYWVNDSKATNADAAGKALGSYKNIYWIVGGRPKDGGLHGLGQFMDRVRYAFVIGEAQDEFAPWLERHGVSFDCCGTMEAAVASALRRTRGKEGVVLLSPACSSFDQFRNFEHRGDVFMALVNGIGGGNA